MKSSLHLNAKVFPVIACIALIMQILDPSRVWVILLIGIGGTWLVCRWCVSGLQRSLTFERKMRFGWAQVGDRLEERFTLTNAFLLPATWVTLHDQSTLPDHHASSGDRRGGIQQVTLEDLNAEYPAGEFLHWGGRCWRRAIRLGSIR